MNEKKESGQEIGGGDIESRDVEGGLEGKRIN